MYLQWQILKIEVFENKGRVLYGRLEGEKEREKWCNCVIISNKKRFRIKMILKSKRCHDTTEVLKNKQPSSMELAWKPILDAYISLVIYLWAAWSNTLFICHLYISSFGKVDGNIISYLLRNKRTRFGNRWMGWGRGTRQEEKDIIIGSEYGHSTW